MIVKQEELIQELERFIEFGTLLDKKTRKYLVQYLLLTLGLEAPNPPEVDELYYQYFSQSLDRIFSNEDLLAMCRERPTLSQQIAVDTLHWVRRTYEKVNDKNPYYEGFQRLSAASVMPFRQFLLRWRHLTSYLNQEYPSDEIPARFYEDKFEQLIGNKATEEISEEDHQEIERVFHDMLAQWDALLNAKLLSYQLKKLEEEQESFKDFLEKKVEEYRKIYQLISPFADYVGRYWDMSRKLWADTHFDILEKYSELLEDEASIKELADMLGKLREAEIMTEEEEYEDVIVRKQWYEDQSQRSEIVGIHESNDLNHLLSSEVGLLSDEHTETVFYQKYADKGLFTLKFEDRELVTSEDQFTMTRQKVRQKAKGPFIIAVDTSDSMSGRAEHIAKVLCFAILKLAAKDHRRAFLINFSVGIQTLDLYDLTHSLDDIVAFLQMSFHGGTDISLALYEVFRQLQSENYRDADVLVISDFIMYKLDDDILAHVNQLQQNKNTQFHSLILSDNPNAEVIEHFDSNWLYDPKQKGIIRELSGKLKRVAER